MYSYDSMMMTLNEGVKMFCSAVTQTIFWGSLFFLSLALLALLSKSHPITVKKIESEKDENNN